MPLDIDTHRRVGEEDRPRVVVHEAPRTCGFGAELVALDPQERASCTSRRPSCASPGFDTPFPYTLENEYLPNATAS